MIYDAGSQSGKLRSKLVEGHGAKRERGKQCPDSFGQDAGVGELSWHYTHAAEILNIAI